MSNLSCPDETVARCDCHGCSPFVRRSPFGKIIREIPSLVALIVCLRCDGTRRNRSLPPRISRGFRSKVERLVILTCIIVTGSNTAVCAAVSADEATAVDQTIVLRIGSHEMSRYVLDKYFNRFVETQRQTSAEATARQAKRQWLELFLAQQLIIAYAETQGYSDHAEVRHIVSMMERHMLTQREGPFYQSLYNHDAIPEARQSRLHASSLVVRQLIIAHFPEEAEAKAVFGNDFEGLSLEKKIEAIARCGENPAADLYRGPITWPFEPYCEIGDFLSATTAGEWFEHSEPPLGTYYGVVQEIKAGRTRSPAIDQAEFISQIREADKRKIQRQRHAELLSSSRFKINESTLAQLADCLSKLPSHTSQIPAVSTSVISGLALFQYQSGNEQITVSVGDYCRHFNEMLVRRFSSSLPLLRLDAENMAVEDLDFHTAWARGIQNTPQFVEDSRGFLGMQMLDLFEKERLLPTIRVDQVAIQNYYQQHAVDFSQVDQIKGRLLTFETREQLDSWYSDRSSVPATESVEVFIEKPLPGFEAIHHQIMQGPAGIPWGPVKHEKGYAVLIKDTNVSTTPLALSDAKPMIQAKLQRQHLDDEELHLAAKLSEHFKIDDQIDYSAYGLTSDEVKPPWHP